jgi:hypothetical protein
MESSTTRTFMAIEASSKRVSRRVCGWERQHGRVQDHKGWAHIHCTDFQSFPRVVPVHSIDRGSVLIALFVHSDHISLVPGD